MRSPAGARWAHAVFLLLLALGAAVAPVDAQRRPGGRMGPQDRAELEERFRRQMARMMQERLGLDEAQAERLSEIVRSFEGPRRELARAEQAARRRVEALVLEGASDEEEARELLDRMVELRRAESDLFREEQEALLELLTPTQVLRLQAMREQLGRRIRALRGRGDGRGAGRGAGGVLGLSEHPGWDLAPTPSGEARGNVDGSPGVGLSL